MAKQQYHEYIQYLAKEEEKKVLREAGRVHLEGSPNSAAEQLINHLKEKGILDAQGNVRQRDGSFPQ